MNSQLQLVLLVLLAVLLASAQQQPTQIIKEEAYSFKAPFISTSFGIMNWETLGDTVVGEEFIRLTADVKSSWGSIWNTRRIDFENWEIIMEFHVGGSGRVGADGLALWYMDLDHNTESRDTSIFGSKNMWRGLGVFFDTFDNDGNGDNPLVSIVYNDGQTFFDTRTDFLNNRLTGCTSKFRNNHRNTRIKLRNYHGVITLYIDLSSTGAFELCGTPVRVSVPVGYHLGVSAATGGLHDNHDIYMVDTYSLDDFGRYERFQQQQQKHQQQQEEHEKQQQQQNQQFEQPQQQQVELENQPPPIDEDNEFLAKMKEISKEFGGQQQQEQHHQPLGTEQHATHTQTQTSTQTQHFPLKSMSSHDEQGRSLIQSVDVLKDSIQGLHSVYEDADTQRIVQGMKDQVEAIGMSITMLGNSIITKKDFNAYKSAYDFKQSQAFKEFADLKQLVTDMKLAVNKRLNNNDQDVSKTLETLSQNVNGLKRLVDATSKDTQKIATSLQGNVNEIASTIERHTSFGFWSYFLIIQAVLIFGFVYWRKHKDDSNKKLM